MTSFWRLKGRCLRVLIDDPRQELKYKQHLLKSPGDQEKDFEYCRRHPWYWYCTWVWTIDPNEMNFKRRIKRFPRKECYRLVVVDLEACQKVIIPKSRQQMISWVCAAWLLHRAIFKIGEHCFWQSKKERDAAVQVARCKFIHHFLPPWQKAKCKPSYKLLDFPENYSTIEAMPQGADQTRGNVPSCMVMDEAAFMPEAGPSYQAVKPAINGGAQIILVSSANPGWFDDMWRDRIKMAE